MKRGSKYFGNNKFYKMPTNARFLMFIKTKDNLIFLLIGNLLILSMAFQNRSLFIGYLFASLIVLSYRFKIRRKTILISIGALVITVLILAISFKHDSSKGRLFIYKISFQILKDTFPKGVGTGNFDITYGEYQIQYFKNGHFSQQEFLLADNITHCYNDLLEIAIEHGLAGLISIIIIVTVAILLIKRAFKLNKIPSLLLLLAVSQILALGIASLFTFIIYQWHWQIILLISILIVTYHNHLVHNKMIIPFSCILIAWILWVHFAPRLFLIKNRSKFTTASEFHRGGYYKEANQILDELYPEIEKNSELVRLYAHCLIGDNRYKLAEYILLKLIIRENSHFNYDLLAFCFRQQKNLKKAEKYYLKAIYKAPNRFNSRFNLFLLYVNSHQIIKARSLGNSILAMPIKIPSPMVDHVKNSVRIELLAIENK